MKRKLIALALLAGFTSVAMASSIVAGNVLVIDQTAGTSQQGALFTVDQRTGTRALFSDFGDASQGTEGVDPNAVTWMPAQLLGLIPAFVLVTDGSGGTNEQGALYKIDPATGSRDLLSDFGDSAQGPLGAYPVAVLAVAPGLLNWSGVLVADPFAGTNGQGVIFSVDTSGNRTTVIDFGDSNGPQGEYPDSLAYFPGEPGLGSTVLVADGNAGTQSLGALFSIDPATGTRSLLSDFGNSAQGWVDANPESTPVSVTVTPSNQIFVLVQELSQGGGGAVVQVDPATGNRTLVSDFSNAVQGPAGVEPNGLTWLPNLSLLGVSDGDAGTGSGGTLFTVDPASGRRGTLSDFGNTSEGPVGGEPSGLAVAQ
ncbi:hypothetical protein ISP15_15675 [Dyella jejuensis]|uniref:DUF4394 domain-containing protein n=1 Tax=Dyella jejuensis TaxID=1432009 RepID=A0ABW8JPM7_9GAMM